MGWIVTNASGNKFRCWIDGWSNWTDDRDQATRYARRQDAEAVHAEDEDAWRVVPFDATADASNSTDKAVEALALGGYPSLGARLNAAALTIRKQADALVAAEARIKHLEAAISRENDDVCQTLGKALGYPWFKDDQKNFPGATERDGVCVGEHVAASIAAEAAKRLVANETRIKALEAQLAALTEPLFPIMRGPAVPWSLIAPYESQARENHGQSLKRLAERGGLSMCEAMAIMSCVPYRNRPIAKPTVEDWLGFIAKRRALTQEKPDAE